LGSDSSSFIEEGFPSRRVVPEDAEKPDDDLRTRLHAMETRIRRMRDQRNGHNEDARRAADSRNAIQEQGKELRESIKAQLDEQKSIRDQAKVHKAKRDEIQNQIRELINQKKGRRSDENNSKSIVLQLTETVSEIDRIENTIMTDGRLTLESENKLLKKLKSLISRRNELLPAVAEFEIIKIDLNDMDGSILILKSEADLEHQAMIDCHKQADEIWEDVKPILQERDFLRAEGDRLHAAYITSREAANEVHGNMKEIIDQCNEIRDEIKAANEERERVIRDHNLSVKDALRTPDQDEGMADSLTEQLLNSGSLIIGGIRESDEQLTESKDAGINKKSGRKFGTARGKK
jgi:uncharacterized coiled-coil DUF342 family protein